MTNVGVIDLKLRREFSREGIPALEYVSENGGYVLVMPRSPHFDNLPQAIEIRVAVEEAQPGEPVSAPVPMRTYAYNRRGRRVRVTIPED